MIFLIAVGVILTAVVVGLVLGVVFRGFDNLVENTKEQINNKSADYNSQTTFGHAISLEADLAEQLVEARREAAKRAASLPRWGNVGIGRLGAKTALVTAGKAQALEKDPITAVKIARHHGWDGARTGAVFVEAVPTAGAGTIDIAPPQLVEISDGMSAADVRKARITNSKAKSVFNKALKAVGVNPKDVKIENGKVVLPSGAKAAPTARTAVAPATAAAQALDIEPPQLIEISDSMSADEVRKARIANSKAKSAFNKALKAAGIDPKDVKIEDGKVVLPAAAVAPLAPPTAPSTSTGAPATETAVTAAAANIPAPDYTTITDDMAPDEIRKARIANAKARSAYNKALKAAGIDPKSIS